MPGIPFAIQSRRCGTGRLHAQPLAAPMRHGQNRFAQEQALVGLRDGYAAGIRAARNACIIRVGIVAEQGQFEPAFAGRRAVTRA